MHTGLDIEKEESYDKKTHTSNRKFNEPIFGENFQVADMSNPIQYLPRYEDRGNEENQSFAQDCETCLGNCLLCCIYPFALCCCKCSCVYEVETSKAAFVQEFGQFKRLLTPGFNLVNPCSEEIVEVDMKIKLVSIKQYEFITKDNVKVTVKSSVAYRIVNPIIAQYKLGENQIYQALSQSTAAGLRNAIGQHNLDDVLTNRPKIVGIAKDLVSQGLPAGLQIDRVFLEDLVIPRQILQDLSSAAKQRRISEATIINSKADTESASLLKEVAQLLDTKAAMQIRYLQMVQQLGKKGVTLMMPVGVNKKGFKS